MNIVIFVFGRFCLHVAQIHYVIETNASHPWGVGSVTSPHGVHGLVGILRQSKNTQNTE